MTIDINFVDASKLEIVKFDMLWIGRNVRWCNGSSLLVGATPWLLAGPWKLYNLQMGFLS
jgi:hypothetical protein